MISPTIATGAANNRVPSADNDCTSSAGFGVTVHAVLPPPVTGMTLCTQGILDAMSQHVPVRSYNWSNGSATITPRFRAFKAVRALLTPWKLLFSRRPAHGVFYMPVNAGPALLFNIVAAIAARVRGYRCTFHHHFYRYLERPDWRLKVVDRLLGSNGLHIVLCPDMENRLRRLYGCWTPIAIIPSTVQLLHADWVPQPHEDIYSHRTSPFCIGHISNLQMAKGLDLVIEVLRVLRDRRRDVRLVLAGPTHSQIEQGMIAAAQEEFGSSIDYRGPVYGAEKQRFFRDLHVKLFPTRYPDAQPLVITESFAFARPVISYGRGCIPGMMGPAAEWSISTDADFVSAAVSLIEHWIDDPAAYLNACRLARRRFEDLLRHAQFALDDFIAWIRCEPVEGFVRRGSAPL
jgi:glycosyltransferase involved in cell wall biosynthesis